MSLKGIDISNWDNGIQIQNVYADFVICKATQGTSYLSPDFKRQANLTLDSGKLLGIYHYASGKSCVDEAIWFYENCKDFINKAIFVLDWESDQNSQYADNDAYWVNGFISKFYELSGKICILYISRSIRSTFDFIPDDRLWIAEYANNNTSYYQDKPWNEDKYKCLIRQYTSCGNIDGFSGNLDLNKFYGDSDYWDYLANGGYEMDASDFWNYGLASNPTASGKDNVEAWIHLVWAHHDTAALYALLVKNHDNVCNGQKDINTRDQIDYIDERVARTNEKVDKILEILSKQNSD